MMIEEAIERLRDRVTIGEFVERMDLDWDDVVHVLLSQDLIDEAIFTVFEDELNIDEEAEEAYYSPDDL
jgi:hypothetical protein